MEFLIWRKCVRCGRWFRKNRKDFWHKSLRIGDRRVEFGYMCNSCYTVLNRILGVIREGKRSGNKKRGK